MLAPLKNWLNRGTNCLINRAHIQYFWTFAAKQKDYSTHRGLMQLVGQRKRLLGYMQNITFRVTAH